MSLNPFLHPRNPYRTRPDFTALAKKDETFRKVAKLSLQGKVTIDFKDRDAVRVLTECLLRTDWNLSVSLPPGTLVPTLPLRFNYLLWIEDLLAENKLGPNPDAGKKADQEMETDAPGSDAVLGMDIGSGASAIYPLLAATKMGWNMMGSEVDPDSLRCAEENVKRNGLEAKVGLFSVKEGANLFSEALAKSGERKLAFTMCNPPFYDKEGSGCSEGMEEQNSEGDAPVPAGTVHEMQTDGGEMKFLERMIDESVAIKDRVALFTCMCGHKTTLKKAKRYLHELHGKSQSDLSFSFTEFCQGKTLRWGLVWSFVEGIKLEDKNNLLKKKQQQKKQSVPIKLELVSDSNPSVDCQTQFQRLSSWLSEIGILVKSTRLESDTCAFRLRAATESWKNARQRRRAQERERERALEEGPSSKRSRPEEVTPVTFEQLKTPALSARVTVHRLSEGSCSCEVVYLDGPAGRDGAHQVAQFIKNKVKGVGKVE